MNNTALDSGTIFQPGIGPFNRKEDSIKRHAYYQWVPFVLFAQALCFYMPHMLWKKWEGGRIKALVYGLRMVGLTKYLKHDSMRIGKLNIPSMAEAEERIINIRRTMIDRMRLNQSWGAHLVFAEVLNLLNLCIQIYWTHRFLGRQFLTLGIKVLRERWVDKMDALDVVFPKVTKCTFYKYGAAGSLQEHDTLCVMALNIMNEKIYTILWFWYSFLLAVTVLGLLWRLLTLFFYKKWVQKRLGDCLLHSFMGAEPSSSSFLVNYFSFWGTWLDPELLHCFFGVTPFSYSFCNLFILNTLFSPPALPSRVGRFTGPSRANWTTRTWVRLSPSATSPTGCSCSSCAPISRSSSSRRWSITWLASSPAIRIARMTSMLTRPVKEAQQRVVPTPVSILLMHPCCIIERQREERVWQVPHPKRQQMALRC